LQLLFFAAKVFLVNFDFYCDDLELKAVAYEYNIVRRSKFKMIFNFLCDDEYPEELGAKRHIGTLGAEKLKST